ncbi:class I SAM-dependent methyltransferase [Candidatus Babeliales bacterium]|nr:class I SAM-dependent methyltransferase [Candidatus Babeliales bacterium]
MSNPKQNIDKQDVQVFDAATGENNTYDLKSREEKERIIEEDVRKHWDIRAQRPDVQSVMSTRHTLEENKRATVEGQREVFEFLEGLVKNKKVFELGVGIGRMTAEIAKRAKEVVGNDISPVMLERARQNLKDFDNIQLLLGKITELDLSPKSFDLVFVSAVLMHILNPRELRVTIKKMQELSDKIFILEHTYNKGLTSSISKYSILRKIEEYQKLFVPYRLNKQKKHRYVGDNFTLMLFEKI